MCLGLYMRGLCWFGCTGLFICVLCGGGWLSRCALRGFVVVVGVCLFLVFVVGLIRVFVVLGFLCRWSCIMGFCFVFVLFTWWHVVFVLQFVCLGVGVLG